MATIADRRWFRILRWTIGMTFVGYAGYAVLRDPGAMARSLSSFGWTRVLLAFVATCTGVYVSERIWHVYLGLFGTSRTQPTIRAFYVGQLGKYVPGSVWSIGYQTLMFRSLGLSSKMAGILGVLFIVGHIASALVVFSIAFFVARELVVFDFPSNLIWLLGVSLGIFMLLPIWANVLSSALSGPPVLFEERGRQLGRIVSMFLAMWLLYGLSLFSLLGDIHLHGALVLYVYCVGSLAAAYTGGTLFLLAPAGIGPREVILFTLVSSHASVADGAAIVALSRFLSVLADVWWAGVFSLHGRFGGALLMRGTGSIE